MSLPFRIMSGSNGFDCFPTPKEYRMYTDRIHPNEHVSINTHIRLVRERRKGGKETYERKKRRGRLTKDDRLAPHTPHGRATPAARAADQLEVASLVLF